MELNKKILILTLFTMLVCSVVIGFVISQMFDTKPEEKIPPIERPASIRRPAEIPFEPLVTEEIKMNPGTRKIAEEENGVKPEASQDNETHQAPAPQPEAAVQSSGPANPLPTDAEIEASIRAQNAQKETADKLAAQRDKKVESVTKSVRSLSQAELSPEKTPPQSENQKPSGEIVAKVRSGEYIYN